MNINFYIIYYRQNLYIIHKYQVFNNSPIPGEGKQTLPIHSGLHQLLLGGMALPVFPSHTA